MKSKSISIIDTHTHLYDQVFRNDRAVVISDARKRGVQGIISVSENLNDAKINLGLAKVHPEIMPAAGLYPGIIDPEQAEQIEAFIVKHARKLVAIGEVGLDRWIVKDEEQLELQRLIFTRFAQLSEELELPLNVHSRSAGRHAIDVLIETNAKKVQMHAFDGKASYALKAVEAGYFFSIPPSIVRSRQKQKLVKQLPLSSLLLETDSPVLGPEPENRNVPANVTLSAEAIAQIKDVSVEEVFVTTWENTVRLYGETKAFQNLLRQVVNVDA